MKSGYRTVSITLSLLAAFAAPHAGRVSENGTGAVWVAPELVAALSTPVQACAETAALRTREWVFETIQPGDAAADEQRLISAASREVVRFEWRADTGELHYDTSAPTGMFSDLAAASSTSARSGPSCESR